MNLNRNNYEEFFLLYVDNELPDTDRKAVESFIRQNPDLEGELLLLQGTKMKPENELFFENKELLMKHEEKDALINLSNYQELFVLYTDGELNAETRKAVEEFATRDPFLQKELIAFQLTRIEPDESLVFEGKEILFREERRIGFLPRIGVAAAALLILLAGYFAFKSVNTAGSVNSIKEISAVVAVPKKSSTQNTVTVKKDQLPVTPAAVEPLYRTERLKKKSQMENKNQIQSSQPENREVSKVFIPENLNLPPIELAKINEQNIMSVHSARTLIVVKNNDIIPTDDQSSSADIHSDPEDGIDQASATESKSKMRGLFRKVSRVFEKTTNAGEDKGKHGILIGGFQIALK